MKDEGNVLFCGVGGQGIILASEILSVALMKAGFDVKKSEVHGMAQRGGSVVAHVRFGEKVFSPLIEDGGADMVLAFEKLEAMRYFNFMKKGTRVILNTQEIFPPSVATGMEEYPGGIIEALEKRGLDVFPVDALSLARETGEVRAVNSVLLGALSNFLPIEVSFFFEVISEKIPERFRDVNRQAFSLGRTAIRASCS